MKYPFLLVAIFAWMLDAQALTIEQAQLNTEGNTVGIELGDVCTYHHNPYGLSTPDSVSCASGKSMEPVSIFTIPRAADQNPQFKNYIGTFSLRIRKQMGDTLVPTDVFVCQGTTCEKK